VNNKDPTTPQVRCYTTLWNIIRFWISKFTR